MDRDILEMRAHGRTCWSDTGEKIQWGAAMSCIIEDLKRAGFVTYPDVQITDKGRAAVETSHEGE
jgi:hypothetical protein